MMLVSIPQLGHQSSVPDIHDSHQYQTYTTVISTRHAPRCWVTDLQEQVAVLGLLLSLRSPTQGLTAQVPQQTNADKKN